MSEAPVLVWLRQDLRLADNPALQEACASGRPLIVCYVLDDETPGIWRIGGASRWWLHHSLAALTQSLRKRGGDLVLRRGAAAQEILKLAEETGAAALYWNRCYEPFAIQRDSAIKEKTRTRGLEVKSFNGALLNEPWEVQTQSGGPFKVFTPYWRACLQRGNRRAPLPAPRKMQFADPPSSDALSEWALLPTRPNWATGFDPLWAPGEAGAMKALKAFVAQRLEDYAEARDQLPVDGTSRLSPHLHWGEISPVQVRAAIDTALHDAPGLGRAGEKFMSELGWRDFSNNLLFHFPSLPEANWRDTFDAMPWRDDPEALEAWRRGRTGYPVVDAAMRELWTTGYMHNRARMIAASFLIKHLMQDWRAGEAWFWDTLLDADLANNAASWQWVAGSGADASPYFRIFNPITQGERYDPEGVYVRRWLPELARLPSQVIHKPWEAPEAVLAAASVELGRTYPLPIVEHGAARARALEAYAGLSSDR